MKERPAPGDFPRALISGLAVVPALLYETGLGRLLGHRLLLVRRGARADNPVLEVISWDPAKRKAVVIAGFGRAGGERVDELRRDPGEVRIGPERFVSRMRRVEGARRLRSSVTSSAATGW